MLKLDTNYGVPLNYFLNNFIFKFKIVWSIPCLNGIRTHNISGDRH
jgi:hypothetical protein